VDKHTARFRWIIIAFLVAIASMSGLLAWQLYDTTPARWCAAALMGSPEVATACFGVLLRLLEVKDHAVLGLMAIVGLSVLSLAVVALGVRINAAGPGGLTANIGAEKTTVTDGESSIVVPTPPNSEVSQ